MISQAPLPAALWIVGSVAGLAFLWWVWTRRILLSLVALLSRIGHNEIYENDARRRVADLIGVNPGVSLNELVAQTGYSRNAISYHLFVLEKEGALVSVKHGKYRRYFPRGGPYANEAKNVVSVLRNVRTLQVAQYVYEHPGAIQRDLCQLLGTTPSATSWHIRRLEISGVISRRRIANTVEYYPGKAPQEYDLSQFGLPLRTLSRASS